jgi:hypothetical protein
MAINKYHQANINLHKGVTTQAKKAMMTSNIVNANNRGLSMSTTAALSLLAFLALSYIVLRFVQRTKSHSQSYSDSGQWNPERTFEFVFDNHFRDEYYRLKNDGSQPNVLGPLLLRR